MIWISYLNRQALSARIIKYWSNTILASGFHCNSNVLTRTIRLNDHKLWTIMILYYITLYKVSSSFYAKRSPSFDHLDGQKWTIQFINQRTSTLTQRSWKISYTLSRPLFGATAERPFSAVQRLPLTVHFDQYSPISIHGRPLWSSKFGPEYQNNIEGQKRFWAWSFKSLQLSTVI